MFKKIIFILCLFLSFFSWSVHADCNQDLRVFHEAQKLVESLSDDQLKTLLDQRDDFKFFFETIFKEQQQVRFNYYALGLGVVLSAGVVLDILACVGAGICLIKKIKDARRPTGMQIEQ